MCLKCIQDNYTSRAAYKIFDPFSQGQRMSEYEHFFKLVMAQNTFCTLFFYTANNFVYVTSRYSCWFLEQNKLAKM